MDAYKQLSNMENTSTMKNGLLIYPHNNQKIFNIGDYIQSIAARQFLGNVDIFLCREHLNEYSGDKVKLIANGWYMHNPNNWPPSKDIEPLFVALHINKLAEEKLLGKESIEYFKKHEPIGCRDYYTVENLKQKGVDAYFSGCLTLTLGQTYKRSKTPSNNIYFTDVNSHLAPTFKFKAKCLKNLIFKAFTLKRIAKRQRDCGINVSWRQLVTFYTTYSSIFDDEVLFKAHYVQQEIKDNFSNEQEKFQYADSLLKRYSDAEYVVTSRIHCALPCLAMNVPVLYVDNQNLGIVHNCRLKGLRELFHKITIKGDNIECDINNKINIHSQFENKKDYILLAENISETCRRFAEQ